MALPILAGLFQLTACDDLTPPVHGLVTTADGGDAGVTPTATLIPEGAQVGGTEKLGGGDCTTWATLNPDGTPKELSLTLPLSTLEAVSGGVDTIFTVALPPVIVEKTILKRMSYSFFPHGHVPVGVYDVPHWEWHIQGIPEEESKALDCTDSTLPANELIPANWFLFPQCVPNAGGGFHAFDLAAPEYNKEKFTKGNYLSYYHAKWVGVEPQATVDVFRARQSFDFIMPPMTKFGRSGLWPKKMVATFRGDFNTYVMTMSDFVAVE